MTKANGGLEEAQAYAAANGGTVYQNNGLWNVRVPATSSSVGGTICPILAFGEGYGLSGNTPPDPNRFSAPPASYWDRVGQGLTALPADFVDSLVKRPLDKAGDTFVDLGKDAGQGVGAAVGGAISGTGKGVGDAVGSLGKGLTLPLIILGVVIVVILIVLSTKGASRSIGAARGA